jgi:small nuclear ribonucleoprotein F
MLQGLVNKEVLIRIKWGQEYTGRLVSVDSYMNVQLSGAKEWKDGDMQGDLGQVLIRYVLRKSGGN